MMAMAEPFQAPPDQWPSHEQMSGSALEGPKGAHPPTALLQALEVRCKEPMDRHTTFGVGGPADYFARPRTIKELTRVLAFAASFGLAITLLGSGTNVLVKDQGIRGLVICLAGLSGPPKFHPVAENTCRVTVPAGTTLAALYRAAMPRGIGGLAFAAGIPGTIGGAVMMNAGTPAGTMADVVTGITLVDRRGVITCLEKEDLVFSHRSLAFAAHAPVTSRQAALVQMDLTLPCQAPETIRKQWETRMAQRRKTQPGGRGNAGCFFKNPPGQTAAGALIDRCGLKGLTMGRAMVSEKHANFILNLGGATARDILAVKKAVEKTVYERFGIHLENEVQIKGE